MPHRDLRDERYDWSQDVPAGASRTVLELHAADHHRVLTWRGTGDTYVVVVTLRGTHATLQASFHCGDGDGGSYQVPAELAAAVVVTAGGGGGVTWAGYVRPGTWAGLPPVDFETGGLTEGAAGAPGAWADATADSGYAPRGRHRADIFTASFGALDCRLLNASGATRGVWQVFGAASIYQPPRYRLQVRHPGGAGDTRYAVVVHRGAG